MKLRKPGADTSKVEIVHISPNGVWLFAKGREHFLAYDEFPWFKKATVAEIHHVQLLHGRHLRWKDLDVDLDFESLGQLEQYPLMYK